MKASARIPQPSPDFAAWCEVADALPTMIFTAHPNGRVEFVNRRWVESTGYDADAALGEAWMSIIHPDDLQKAKSAWRRSIECCDELAIELRIRRSNGSFFWVMARAAPYRDDRGDIIRWCGTAIDIDARKGTEEALSARERSLRDSERRFRVLAEAIPVMCWTADATGWIDWYNRRWYDFTGQAPDEAAGWGWQAAHHPDDFLEVMKAWPRSIATGEPFEMEFRLRRWDGAFHWFLTRAEPLRDESGAIVRWYGSNIDINSQKQALERTLQVARTFQHVFLPKELPQKPNLRLDAVYLPAEADALVGGDWFDAFELPDGRICFSIGDVAGHGLEASIIVGKLRQVILTLAFSMVDPAAILKELDRILTFQEPGTMATALAGFVDPSLRTITYASAGHPPPLIAVKGGGPAKELPLGGLPLGADLGFTPVSHRIDVEPESVIALYTDGMVEFSRDLQAAENRLRTAVAMLVGDTSIARPAIAVKDIVFDEAPTKDDAALLILQFSPASKSVDRSIDDYKTWRFHSSDAHTASTSRQAISAYLREMAANEDQIFAAEVIIGEMIANTVEHAPGLVEVRIDWTGEKPVVAVRDKGPGLRAEPNALPNLMAESGRGLFLIRAFAESTYVQTAKGRGTEISVVLPTARKLSEP